MIELKRLLFSVVEEMWVRSQWRVFAWAFQGVSWRGNLIGGLEIAGKALKGVGDNLSILVHHGLNRIVDVSRYGCLKVRLKLRLLLGELFSDGCELGGLVALKMVLLLDDGF